MSVYGRSELIARFARSRAAVSVLCGDSGVGKSTVLQEAQARGTDAVAPAPRTIPISGAVLQRALLEVLSDAVAEIVAEGRKVEVVAEQLVNAAQRLAREQAQELAKVVGKELLALLKSRLGPHAGEALADYLKTLKKESDEALAQRISASVDPGVAGLVVDFMDEVAALAEGKTILLALDAGERLAEEDIRLLAELAQRIPDAIRLRIAVSTYTTEVQARLELLRVLGSTVSIVEVPGLEEDAIADWLEARGLDGRLAKAVRRATGGYALHVGDMVAHLQHGGQIEDVPLNRTFSTRTKEAWNSLDRDAKTKARTLCVFGDPLPADRMEKLLGLDNAARAQLEEDLSRARVFSVEVNGRPWFHEQRRQLLVDEILQDDERAEACARAVEELLEFGRESDTFDRLPELAGLVPGAKRLLAADDQLAAAVALDRNELALAAGLIELIEASTPAVLGDALLNYTTATFGGQALIEALERLGSRGIVAVVKQEHAAAVVPYWRNVLVKATIIGRAFNELGRMPVPAVASSVFGLEILSRIGEFEKGHYGIGLQSVAGLAELIPALRQPPERQVVIGGDLGENLLLRGRYEGRPLYGAFTFKSAARRDEATEALAGLSSEVFGEQVEVSDVIKHPVDPVPSRRFLTAIERLTGESFSAGKPSLALKESLEPAEVLRRKAAALKVIRARSTRRERMALELEEPMGFVWHAESDDDGEVFFEAEVRGGREGAEPIESRPNLVWKDPYSSFKLTQQVKLEPGERLGHQRVRLGKAPEKVDPVVALLADLYQRAKRFNKAQKRRHPVLLEADELTATLTAAAQQALDDAQALAGAAPIGETETHVEAKKTYLIVYLDPPDPSLVVGGFSSVIDTSMPNPRGDEEVHLAIVPRRYSSQRYPAIKEDLPGFRELFGLAPDNTKFSGQAVIDHAIAPRLGFSPEEITFELPVTPS